MTYANVAMTLALVFAMTGGAYAAKKYLITSTKQISPSVLKQLKGAAGPAGSAGAQGLAGPVGPQGSAGAKGETGPKGATGAVGPTGPKGATGSPWSAGGTLPSGETETGAWAFLKSAIPNGTVGESVPISFPIPLAAALGKGGVHMIAPNGKELVAAGFSFEEVTPTKCGSALSPQGSVANPAAAPGNLCVYVTRLAPQEFSESNAVASSYIVPLTTECFGFGCEPEFGGPGAGSSTAGARIALFYSEQAEGYGAWAVTAP